MILTLEMPKQGAPRCWFAFDEYDFIRKVRATHAGGDVIYQTGSARKLLDACAPADSAGLRELAQLHGWDVPLYRADYLLARGYYQAEEVSEFLASIAAVAHGLSACRVYPDEELAMDALESEPLYQMPSGYEAHRALRDQLIALEVIADDL